MSPHLLDNGGVGGIVRHFHLHQVDLRAGGAQARQLIYATQFRGGRSDNQFR